MRDHVVQLARDPRLLLGQDAARLGLALPLESSRLLLDLADVGASGADAVAEQPGADEEHETGERVAELPQAAPRPVRRDRRDRGGAAGAARAALADAASV